MDNMSFNKNILEKVKKGLGHIKQVTVRNEYERN